MKLVFAYREYNPKPHKFTYTWYRLDKDELKNTMRFQPKNGKNITSYTSPGMIYDMDSTDDKSVYPTSAIYCQKFENEDLIKEWIATDKAAYTAKTAVDVRRKAFRTKTFDFGPLNRAYRSTSAGQRAGMLAWFIHEVTK